MPRRIAILLCAGYGTRMGALTAETPKPLLPVAGRPVLDYLLEHLLELDGLGAVHVVSNARYVGAFRDWAGGWLSRLGARGPELTVHDDGSASNADRLGAIGDLGFVLRHLEPPAGALVAAGDNIYRFSLRPLWRAFLDGGGSWVLGLEEPDPAKLRRTGVLELGAGSRVVRLHEKPEEPPSTLACPSLYCLDAAALARVAPYLESGRSSDEIGRFIGHLVDREPVYAFEASGERLHVGSPESYRRANEVMAEDLAP
ncbi:MAG: nucleotidyltransferase family protein [bacterium]|nr:nucleotidyltransferase family protein [bacterium]